MKAPKKAVKRQNKVAAARSARPAVVGATRCHGEPEAQRRPRRGGGRSVEGRTKRSSSCQPCSGSQVVVVDGWLVEEKAEKSVVPWSGRRRPSEEVATAVSAWRAKRGGGERDGADLGMPQNTETHILSTRAILW